MNKNYQILLELFGFGSKKETISDPVFGEMIKHKYSWQTKNRIFRNAFILTNNKPNKDYYTLFNFIKSKYDMLEKKCFEKILKLYKNWLQENTKNPTINDVKAHYKLEFISMQIKGGGIYESYGKKIPKFVLAFVSDIDGGEHTHHMFFNNKLEIYHTSMEG